MPQSLAKIYVHIVFSTKLRESWLTEKIQPELYAYMAGILKTWESPGIQIGGMPDHVHILSMLSKNHAACKVVEEVKKGSSKWIKTKGAEFKNFSWQNGYGIFSISPSHVDKVKTYIENQKEHHRRTIFMDEFRKLLKKYDIPYDERYVWD
ncbi:MAG: IS200/IS605 family transposase [Calditrichaceae bacterium]|nr:IS200/IS605 family transposase [Calditrichia bacterium]NUQ43761.1 IS200/IS605 family transposase [Calditrichaceae bacterium]